ncbi:hypothetical protein PSTH68_06145 [Pseudomonas syringae pv. theae]|nr:hypothetical protein PSTH68_06145 [Pseudomonas syringae pv. theae]
MFGIAEDAQLRRDQALKLRGDCKACADYRSDRRHAGAGVGDAVLTLHAVQRIAGPVATEAMGIEHRQRHGLLFMRRKADGLHPDQALVTQQRTDLGAGLARHNGQIKVLALQQQVGRFAVYFHLNQRISLRELRKDAGQKAHHVIVGRADFHHADHVRLAQGVEHFAVQLENPPCVAEQYLALCGEVQGPAFTLKQLTLNDILLQTLHLHADRRLSAVDHFTCASKTAVVGNGHKGTKQFGINARIIGQTINLPDELHKKHSLG